MSHEPQSLNVATAAAERTLFRWGLAASVAVLLAMAAPMLGGRVPTRDDLGAFHLPVRAFYAEQLAHGEPFDWMPQLYCGFYVTGEGQAGMYHPLHWLVYRFLPLSVAWCLELWLSYPLLLVGTYFFLRRLVRRRDAAMFGSLAFTFSGFMLLRFVHPNAVAVAAHVPWLLWAIDVLLSDQRPSRTAIATAAVALLTGSQILLGYPQYVWFSLVAEAAYVVIRFCCGRVGWIERSERHHKEDWWGSLRSTHPTSRLLQLAIAKTAGVMLGGVQLLPTVEALGQSVRYTVDAAFVNTGSLHPLNLVQLVAPYLFTHRVAGENTHELGLYLGAVPLVLVVWTLSASDCLGRLRRPAWVAALAGLIALVLAFGKYGPLYGWQASLPLVGGFRFSSRYVLLFSLAAAVVASVGFVLLAKRSVKPRPWRRGETIAIWLPTVAAAVAAGVGLAVQGSPFVAKPGAVLVGLFLIGLASLLVFLAARGNRGALVAAVLLAAADLGFYGLSYGVYLGRMRLDEFAASRHAPPTTSGRVLVDRGLSQFSSERKWDCPPRAGDRLVLAGFHLADGYAGLEPARRLDYRCLETLQAAGVHWVKRDASNVPGDWQEVPNPLPRFRLVSRAVESDDPAGLLAEIADPNCAVVDEPLLLGGGTPGTVTVLADRPGRIEVSVNAPGARLLAVSESYHPGWEVYVDGAASYVWPVNGDFLGCPVTAGEHVVRFAFAPKSLRRGWIVTLLGGLLLTMITVRKSQP